MKVLLRLAPVQVPRLQSTQLDLPVLLGAIALSILTGFAIGLAPAFYATRSGAAGGSRVHGSAGYRRVRSLVVISEIALAVLLTVSTGLLVRSLLQVLNVNPGFAVEQLHTFTISMVGPRYAEDEPVIAFQRTVLERIKALPGVEHAAMVSTLPIGGGYDRRGFHIRDRAIPSAEAPDVDGYYVTPDYFLTMQIPIIKGRRFTAADEAPGAPPVALISERAAREHWPGEDPIGKGIQLGGRNEQNPWATIIGIAGDVRQYGLDAPATPQAYLLYTQGAFSIPQLLVRSTLENEVLARSVEREIWALDKTVPVRTAAMEDVVAASLAQRRFTLGLLGGFAALSLLLAVVGIYGVMAYSVAQRTKELGVRMALGAQRKQIFAEVIRQGLGLTVFGLIGGFIAALGVTRLLGGWLFGITPTDVVTFSLVAILIVIVATLASIIPARRAIRVDPAAALRWD
jgi:putative ABC transport system permease protein